MVRVKWLAALAGVCVPLLAGARPGWLVTNLAGGSPPVAEDTTATTDGETPVTVTLRAMSTIDVTLSFSIVSAPAHATLDSISEPECSYPNGMASCTAIVVYTPAAGYVGVDTFTYQASDGVSPSNVATASVTVTGAPVMPPAVMLAVDDPYVALVSSVLPGATVNYGDDSGDRLLETSPDGSASLSHLYAREGSFTVTVVNPPGDAATSLVHVMLSGLSAFSSEAVSPDASGTIELPDLTATLTASRDRTSGVTFLGAVYPPALRGFFLGGLFGEALAAFDVRVVGGLDGDSVTVAFGYPDGGLPTLPILTFMNPVTNEYEPVVGSVLVSPSLSIDPVARLITVVLDHTSRPLLARLTGTRLVVSDLEFPRVTEVREASTTKRGSRVIVHMGQTASCPVDGPSCAISLRIRAQLPAPKVIARRRLRLPAGETRDIDCTLSRTGARLVRRLERVPVTLAVRVAVGRARPRTVLRTAAIEPPP